jgi:O-antigen ligase
MFALAGLLALWLWSFVSMTWGESAEGALNEANRWLLYAALFAVLVLLLRDDALGRRLIAFATVAILALAGYLAVDMLVGDPRSLFLAGRLNEPLGYVNGQAGYLLLALWPLIALAERARRRILGSASIAAATLLVGLVFMSQTRGAVPALVLTAIVLIAVIPGRPKRAWALTTIVAGVAIAAPALIDVYQAGGPGVTPPDAATIHRGIEWLLVAAVAAGAAWGIGNWAAGRLGERLGDPRATVASVAVLAALLVPAAAAVVIATGDPVEKVRRQVHAFLHLERRSEPTRLVSGSGNRYDYWRIAAIEFGEHPVRGVGAGNYDQTYYVERRTTQDVRQPHSIELQTLAETGVVGALALLLFLGGVLAGFARRASLARRDPAQATLAVAGGGMFLTWLVHTSVDWLHLMPGVTGMALAAGAVLVAPWPRTATRERSTVRWVTIGVAVIVVLFGAIEIGRSALAHSYRSSARDALNSNPLRALKKANDSLALNEEAVPTYYVKASAYARLGRYRESKRTLLQAAAREPNDFVTWALLGDLAGRAGRLELAARYYARASWLNPQDPTLRRFADHPEEALRRR